MTAQSDNQQLTVTDLAQQVKHEILEESPVKHGARKQKSMEQTTDIVIAGVLQRPATFLCLRSFLKLTLSIDILDLLQILGDRPPFLAPY